MIVMVPGTATASMVTPGDGGHVQLLQSTEQHERDEVARIRAKFGLPVDDESIDRVVPVSENAGYQEWNIPMTAGEARTLDPEARTTFVQSLGDEVLPLVRALDTYAGVWIDQMHGGGLVVMVTGDADQTQAKLEDLMPKDSLGVRVERADHSYRELSQALDEAPDVLAEVDPKAKFASVGIDAKANGLKLKLIGDASDPSLGSDMTKHLGVPVKVFEGGIGQDLAGCRVTCDPIKPGVQIFRSSFPEYQEQCTLGFFVQVGDDTPNPTPSRQFLTAGHCGLSGAINWVNPGLSDDIGNKQASLIHEGGIDAMRVGVKSMWVPDHITRAPSGVGAPDNYHGASHPVQDEIVCMSLGKSKTNPCGTIDTADTHWRSESCDCHVYGAAMDTDSLLDPIDCPPNHHDSTPSLCPGDSGSPVYRPTYPIPIDGHWDLTPIGIADHEYYKDGAWGGRDVYFAVVRDVVDEWDLSMWHP